MKSSEFKESLFGAVCRRIVKLIGFGGRIYVQQELVDKMQLAFVERAGVIMVQVIEFPVW